MKQQDHNTPSIIRKIGKTTYIANAYFDENATENIDGKIKRMLRKDVEKGAISEKKKHKRYEKVLDILFLGKIAVSFYRGSCYVTVYGL